MAIQFGNDKIKEIYVGSDKIKEVYYGSELVWGIQSAIQDGYWVHKDTNAVTYFGLEDPSIVNGIMSKPSWASDCSEVKIPSAVTELGTSCFQNCPSLTSITLPDNLTSIGSNGFRVCSKLTSITIPNSVTSIGNECFYGCIALTSITIPNSVTYLSSRTFEDCRGLLSVNIPGDVTKIAGNCFNGCLSLTSIYILSSTAPYVYSSTFGTGYWGWTGRNTYNQGVNMLYVPQGATGYDASYWLDPLQDATKCGFTISYTL